MAETSCVAMSQPHYGKLRISSDTVLQERSPVMICTCTGVELRPPARLTLHVRGEMWCH